MRDRHLLQYALDKNACKTLHVFLPSIGDVLAHFSKDKRTRALLGEDKRWEVAWRQDQGIA